MNVRHGEQVQQVYCVCCHRWNNLLRINVYLGLWVLGRNNPKLGADRPRSWGGSTAFGADVGWIDPVRIDSGADRPVPDPSNDSQTTMFLDCMSTVYVTPRLSLH